jgi:hypothetical protein
VATTLSFSRRRFAGWWGDDINNDVVATRENAPHIAVIPRADVLDQPEESAFASTASIRSRFLAEFTPGAQ